MKSRTWTMLGQGAIGLLAASRMQLAGLSVQLKLRENSNSMEAQPNHLAVKFQPFNPENSPQTKPHFLQFPCIQGNSPTSPLQWVLLPLKAFAIENAVAHLVPHLAENAQLVLCHNGMGTIEAVVQYLKPEQGLWFASTTQGAFKKTGPEFVELFHSGLGQTFLAPCNAAAQQGEAAIAAVIASDLNHALGPITVVDDITPILWRKLAINAIINPLTARDQIKNGGLKHPSYQAEIQTLLQEFLDVATATGMHFEAAPLYSTIMQVIEATAENYSSMQQDVALNRPTELEAITGFLLKTAHQHDIKLPTHQALYTKLANN